MTNKTNITIFATYWNEIDWIEASLAQIDKINPKEIVICDGCFDPSFPNYSTDGTREIIKEWVSSRENVQVISARRVSKLVGLWYLFGHKLTIKNIFGRILMFIFYLRTNIYRINQASTFVYMSRIAKNWEIGDWFMNMDADQFYADKTIHSFIKICNSKNTKIELLLAKEKTFFRDFDEYTNEYEKREYNNMPHRIKKNTLIVPTRDIITEQFPKPKAYGKDKNIKKKFIGEYSHYKFHPKNKFRTEAGYRLGDRKKPDYLKYAIKKNMSVHPSVVQNIVEKWKRD